MTHLDTGALWPAVMRLNMLWTAGCMRHSAAARLRCLENGLRFPWPCRQSAYEFAPDSSRAS
jgi:hypothetical protein